MIFCNGLFIDASTPVIEASDRGFLFGDAVFTTIKVIDGIPQFLEAHFERLRNQCEMLHIIPPELNFLEVKDLITKNKATKGIYKLKIVITGGNGTSLTLETRPFGKHLMMIMPIVDDALKEYQLNVFPFPLSSCVTKLKTLSYLDRLFVHDYAKKKGFDEAVVLSLEGFITETAFANIFWCLGNDVFIPDFTLGFLVGVTLSNQIEIFKQQGKKIHFVKEFPQNIPQSASIFICNSIKGVVPVSSIKI